MDFLFVIPLTPLKLRNGAREFLWDLTKRSLIDQKHKNWKALVLGSKKDKDADKRFIFLDYDDLDKIAKMKKALEIIDKEFNQKPNYIIRIDDDDIFSNSYLSKIDSEQKKYDAYVDSHHVCIDPLYHKISYTKKNWFPNTVIHKYEHAITKIKIANLNEALFAHDHDICWHHFYKDKDVYYSKRRDPLYYRILTPFSITSNLNQGEEKQKWEAHSVYLNSYGPWISLGDNFSFSKDIRQLKQKYLFEPPKRSVIYWIYNSLKFYAYLITNKTVKTTGALPKEYL